MRIGGLEGVIFGDEKLGTETVPVVPLQGIKIGTFDVDVHHVDALSIRYMTVQDVR